MQDKYTKFLDSNVSDSPPPSYNEINRQASITPESRKICFLEILNRYEINNFFAKKLKLLNTFKIVFIVDDSGSMNATLSDSPLNIGLIKATRWDELRYFSRIFLEIANVFNQDGTDIYFLNRPMAQKILSFDQLLPHFQKKPSGFSPISRVLRSVLANNQQNDLREKNLLTIIITDGEPTDDNGRIDIKAFEDVLESRNVNTFTTIISCTDQKDNMLYLNKMDRKLPRLDVIDDYRNERLEVLKAQGRNYNFSFGDYVVKSMIGSIDPNIDNLDEIANKMNIYPKIRKSCSIM